MNIIAIFALMKTILLIFLFLTQSTFASSSISFDFFKGKYSKDLVVVIHGCKQNSKDFVDLIKIKKEQKIYGFDILAPNQGDFRNIYRCWNWFSNFSALSMDYSEAGMIERKIRHLKEKNDYRRVYLIGLSSGAAQAFNIATCNRDLVNGVLLHSGVTKRPSFNPQKDMAEVDFSTLEDSVKFTKFCQKPKVTHKLRLALVVQGDKDDVVHPDNGKYSFAHLKSIFTRDFIMGPREVITIKYKNKYRIKKDFIYAPSFGVKLESLHIKGLTHAWSGGAKGHKYSDPKGPNVLSYFFRNFYLMSSP